MATSTFKGESTVFFKADGAGHDHAASVFRGVYAPSGGYSGSNTRSEAGGSGSGKTYRNSSTSAKSSHNNGGTTNTTTVGPTSSAEDPRSPSLGAGNSGRGSGQRVGAPPSTASSDDSDPEWAEQRRKDRGAQTAESNRTLAKQIRYVVQLVKNSYSRSLTKYNDQNLGAANYGVLMTMGDVMLTKARALECALDDAQCDGMFEGFWRTLKTVNHTVRDDIEGQNKKSDGPDERIKGMRAAFRVAAPENPSGDEHFRMLCKGTMNHSGTGEGTLDKALLLAHELVSDALSRHTVHALGDIANLLAQFENLEKSLAKNLPGGGAADAEAAQQAGSHRPSIQATQAAEQLYDAEQYRQRLAEQLALRANRPPPGLGLTPHNDELGSIPNSDSEILDVNTRQLDEVLGLIGAQTGTGSSSGTGSRSIPVSQRTSGEMLSTLALDALRLSPGLPMSHELSASGMPALGLAGLDAVGQMLLNKSVPSNESPDALAVLLGEFKGKSGTAHDVHKLDSWMAKQGEKANDCSSDAAL